MKTIHIYRRKSQFANLYLVLSIFLLGFSSCQIAKTYTKPAFDSTGLYRVDKNNSEDTTSVSMLSIEEFYKDKKLQNLIHEGLLRNSDIRIALERIIQAQHSLKIAKATLFPGLVMQMQDEYSRFSNSNNTTKSLGFSTNQLYLGFSASWEIDVWQKLNSSKKAKIASYLNSYESLAFVQTNLVANIAMGYYNLIAMDEQMRTTQKTIELLKKESETIVALKKAGQLNSAAIEQSNALLYRTQLSIHDIEIAIRQQENGICLLLGRKPGPIERNTINEQIIPDKMNFGVPAQLLANRSDVKSAELAFREAFELTNVARASLYPSIRLNSAFLGFNGNDFSNLFKPESIVANIIGNITQPIINQRQLKENLEISISRQKEASINFENVFLSAGREVSDLFYGFETSLKKDDWRVKQVKSLTNAVEYSEDLLKAGEANYIEVLDAQRNLLEANMDHIKDKLDQLSYAVSLYKALGGGYKNLPHLRLVN